MWTALALTLCMGAPAPDMSNCIEASDSWGPYDTKEQCLARVEVMKETFPPAFAIDFGYPGPIAVLSSPEGCEAPGEPA